MSSSPAHHRPPKAPMCFPLQQPQPQSSCSLIASEAEQLSKHMIEQHRNTAAAVCKALQTRVLELRGDTNTLKRSAKALIRECGKRVRRDMQMLVDGVNASAHASEQRACGAKINQIWKRNSILTEENTMLQLRLGDETRRAEEQRSSKQRLCDGVGQAARAQAVATQAVRAELGHLKQQVLVELKAFHELSAAVEAGVVNATAGCGTADAAVQTEAVLGAKAVETSAQTELLEARDSSTQTRGTEQICTDAACQTVEAPAQSSPRIESSCNLESHEPPGVGDFVVQASAGRGPIVGRVMHILPSGGPSENDGRSQAFLQLYERTWRNSPPCSSCSPPLAPASPTGTE